MWQALLTIVQVEYSLTRLTRQLYGLLVREAGIVKVSQLRQCHCQVHVTADGQENVSGCDKLAF